MAEDHYSLSAKVFHSIREDILNGKYQANEELKEKNIGDDLGVSRTPGKRFGSWNWKDWYISFQTRERL